MALLLAGRVAVITGAGRGIGAASAKALAQQGARIVVNDMSEENAEETAQALRAAGCEAMAIAGSVVEEGFPERLMSETVNRFGSPDILVNNAGFLWDGMTHKMTDQQWQAIVDCHLTAPMRMIRAAGQHMRAAAKEEQMQGGPPQDRCIINISSTSGLHGNVGQANYAAAKAGIIGLTKTIAKEWGPLGIRANAIAFGMIDTRMTNAFDASEVVHVEGEAVPQGLPKQVAAMFEKPELIQMTVPLARKGRPEEAAGGILFLASPLASYVTGHTLEVTGGMGI